MKTLYPFLSNLASLAIGYIFVTNLKFSLEFNYIVIMSLLGILFFIFVIISVLTSSKRPRSRSLFYNSYSDRRTKNQEFDKYYSFMNE
ncbi:MAG: hypothetical protein ABIQ27_13065 [Flavobacterium sp.]|uniref:hypothetical protein n=1 Tax=Flavobacterium sp. TaxID=239 RepID=UPI0032638029